MKRENDECIKEERKPERLPYVKPMSWVIKMSPLSLLAGTSTGGSSAGGGFGESEDDPDGWD